jgi:ParB family chromosome partitioning protein
VDASSNLAVKFCNGSSVDRAGSLWPWWLVRFQPIAPKTGLNMEKLELKYRAIKGLKGYANNSRTHAEKQIKQIEKSIKEFGFTNPILIDEDDTIIAGHGRLEAAKQAGLDEVPTVCIAGLSDKQKRALIIADNKLALNAGWDFEILSAEVQELKDDDFEIELLGFDAGELDDILGLSEVEVDDIDVVDEPKTECTISIVCSCISEKNEAEGVFGGKKIKWERLKEMIGGGK